MLMLLTLLLSVRFSLDDVGAADVNVNATLSEIKPNKY